MTLGSRIQALRKQHNLSQQDLADKLNVSLGTVSDWESGLAAPDAEAISHLAGLFGIPVDELVDPIPEDAPSAPRASLKSKIRIPHIAIFLILLVVLAGAGIRIATYQAGTDDGEMPSADSILEFHGEYVLCRAGNSSSSVQVLAVGAQDGAFPWNTDLAGSDTAYTSGDMPGLEFHTVDCGNIEISYHRSIESGNEALALMRTASPDYTTPRDIGPGSTETDLITAYGDALLFRPEIFSSRSNFCQYNSLYAFQNDTDISAFIIFYVLDGEISGIEVSLIDDGGFPYYVDNTYTFQLINGTPDYSEKQEPELETLSKEREVYVALHTLLNYWLTDADAAPYRETVFNGLHDLDWVTYGKLGEAGKEMETIEELLGWIDAQETYADKEIAGIQLAPLSNIDGIYADMYSTVLCNVFLKNPASFIERLSNDPGTAENSEKVVMLTVYGATITTEKLESVKAAIQELLNSGALSDESVLWANRLLDRCDHPID